MPKETTIFTAELYAIEMAVSSVAYIPNQKFVIFTDSLSSLRCLSHGYSTHPSARKIQHEVSRINVHLDKTVKFCWVPSHVGIAGNELADIAAAGAATCPERIVPIFYKDLLAPVRHRILQAWTRSWQESGQKLLQVKANCKPFITIPGISRRSEVIMCRLRSGHTRITHGHLMESNNPNHTVPRICPFCNNRSMTVRHILVDCAGLDLKRDQYQLNSGSLEEILGDLCQFENLMGFLTDIGIYNEI